MKAYSNKRMEATSNSAISQESEEIRCGVEAVEEEQTRSCCSCLFVCFTKIFKRRHRGSSTRSLNENITKKDKEMNVSDGDWKKKVSEMEELEVLPTVLEKTLEQAMEGKGEEEVLPTVPEETLEQATEEKSEEEVLPSVPEETLEQAMEEKGEEEVLPTVPEETVEQASLAVQHSDKQEKVTEMKEPMLSTIFEEVSLEVQHCD